MGRFVDADKMQDFLERHFGDEWDKKQCSADWVYRFIEISASEADDVVEVVRCKDCKHWGGVTFGYVCRRFSGSYIRNETRETDFCNYGERKEK